MSADEEQDGYVSEEDEDYVPEEGVDDIEYASGEEEDPLDDTDDVKVKGKRRGGKKGAETQLTNELATSSENVGKEGDCCADFLDDLFGIPASTSAPAPVVPNPTVTSSKKSVGATTDPKTHTTTAATSALTSEKTVVTDVFDFAGTEVRIQREVTDAELEERRKKEEVNEERAAKRPTIKRTGLGNVLTTLAKKKKISTLDKTALDWEGFKEEHRLKDELETFNRGKDGYLNKVDFLQKTDVMEFEREKAMRSANRRH